MASFYNRQEGEKLPCPRDSSEIKPAHPTPWRMHNMKQGVGTHLP